MHPVVLHLLRMVRGGRRARHVIPAVMLGALAGAVCGWNLTFAALVLAAFVWNGPLGLTVAAAAISFALTRAAAALMHALGGFLLEKLGLGAVMESLGHGPVVSLLGWDEYELVGAAVTAICLALPVAHALGRRAMTQGRASPSSPTSICNRIIRPYGLPLGAACGILAFVLPAVIGPQLVGEALLAQWSAAVDGRVTADSIAYDLGSGELQLAGIRVYGHKPGRVMLRIDRASGRVEPGLMLRGCLHCDELALSGIEYDSASTPSTGSSSTQPTVLREDDPGSTRATSKPIDAARFVRDWDDAQRRFAVLGAVVRMVELVADLETQPTATARLQAARRPRKTPLDPLSGRALPVVQIKRLTIEGLPETWSLGKEASLELTNVASRPASTARSTQLTVNAPSREGRITIGFRLSTAERRHDLTASWDNGAAASVVDTRRVASAGIDVTYAQLVALRGHGWMTTENIDLPLTCEVRGVVPAATGASFGDVDGSVWHAGISRLSVFRFDVTLSGRLNDAKLQAVPATMVDQLKHQLRAAGEHALVKAVDAGRLPVEPPARLASATATTTGASPIATAVETDKKPEAATVPAAAVPTPMIPAVTTPGATIGAASLPPKSVAPVRESTTIPAATTPTVSSPAIATAGPTPTPPQARPAAAAVDVVSSAPLPIVGNAKPTPAIPAPPTAAQVSEAAATAPTTSHGPADVGVPSFGSTHGLRQPASVAATSAKPSFAEGSSRYEPPHQAPAKPAAGLQPKIAAQPRPLTNLPPQQAGTVAPPKCNAVPTEEPKPSLMARLGWFKTENSEEPATSPPTPAPKQPEATAAAKPYFPRLRALFAEEPEPEQDFTDYATMPPIAERPATIPADTQPAPTDIPATAAKPWYGRLFR